MKKFLILTIIFLNINIFAYAQGESVICLHGFLRSFKCMIPLGHSLQNEGFQVYLWDYRSRSKKIEEHAADLVEILNVIAAKKPGQPIHFVTHSLGGIIIRAAVNHPNCPKEAKMGKAVLLAPPNKGAVLARTFQHSPPVRWVFGKGAGRQLLNYTEEDMGRFGQFPETMEIAILAGSKKSRFTNRWIQEENDGKVTINETCLDTPHYHYVNYVSHNWIMTSRQTINMTKSYFLFGSFDHQP